ncbi:MAG: hypothetical protein R3B47_16305 [Bacteroidia bacterium]
MGGKLLDIAREKACNHIVLPGGAPPRTAAGYSIVQQLRILHGYGLIPDFFPDLEESVTLIEGYCDKGSRAVALPRCLPAPSL